MTVQRVTLPWAQPVFARLTMGPTEIPLRGKPTVDDLDREAYVHGDLIALAIALDIFATHTQALTESPIVLSDLVTAALAVGAVSSVNQEELLEIASTEGDERAALLQRENILNNPASVLDAARRIEAAAQLLIREVKLQMLAKERVDILQA